MNRVITINLNGNAYQLEESGYEALRAYLDDATRRLEGNPDKEEIVADIEQAIAEKFRAVLGANKTVVITKEVTAVIAEMGPVEDGKTDAQPSAAGAKHTSAGEEAEENTGGSFEGRSPRRLYRIHPDGAMLSGVCNGLAAYLNIDVTFVRIGFVVLSWFWGTGVLVYILLAIIVPVANTPAEKSAASGAVAATAQEFIRRAKAGYYDGMKTFHDKQAHRAWKRKFKQEMRDWKHRFKYEATQSAQQWQQDWRKHWQDHPQSWMHLGFAAPLLESIRLLFFCFGVYAVYSLIVKGSVFGLLLPVGIPVWVGVVILLVLYQILTLPLKALRYACYYQGPARYGCSPWFAGPMTGILWLAFLVAVVWLTDHYVPQFHEALKQIPPVLHQALDSVQKWLDRT